MNKLLLTGTLALFVSTISVRLFAAVASEPTTASEIDPRSKKLAPLYVKKVSGPSSVHSEQKFKIKVRVTASASGNNPIQGAEIIHIYWGTTVVTASTGVTNAQGEAVVEAVAKLAKKNSQHTAVLAVAVTKPGYLNQKHELGNLTVINP